MQAGESPVRKGGLPPPGSSGIQRAGQATLPNHELFLLDSFSASLCLFGRFYPGNLVNLRRTQNLWQSWMVHHATSARNAHRRDLAEQVFALTLLLSENVNL